MNSDEIKYRKYIIKFLKKRILEEEKLLREKSGQILPVRMYFKVAYTRNFLKKTGM